MLNARAQLALSCSQAWKRFFNAFVLQLSFVRLLRDRLRALAPGETNGCDPDVRQNEIIEIGEPDASRDAPA